ncbi:MAG: hypothetical protein RSA53_07055, partial [Odoribacter sp.]
IMWFPFKNSVCVRQMLCLLLYGWTACGWANNGISCKSCVDFFKPTQLLQLIRLKQLLTQF